jgi:hypothetical protein
MARRTAYQRTHYPTRIIQMKCVNLELDEDDLCTACGRWLQRRVVHNPNVIGSLGWVEHYADGSTYHVEPGKAVSHPGS